MDQLSSRVLTIELDEGAKAGTLALAKKGLVKSTEPIAKVFKIMVLTDLVDLCLDGLRVSIDRQCIERLDEVFQRCAFGCVGRTVLFGGLNEVSVVGDCMLDKGCQDRCCFDRRVGCITGDEAPQDGRIFGVANAGEIEQ